MTKCIELEENALLICMLFSTWKLEKFHQQTMQNRCSKEQSRIIFYFRSRAKLENIHI